MGFFNKEEYDFTSGDGHHVKLKEPIEYTTNDDIKIVVPAGFYSDGASVPRFLWRIFPPFGDYWRAALLHDFLYFCGEFVRSKCDTIFLAAMKDCKVSFVSRRAIYTGVRIGGWKAYGNYRKKEKSNVK